jgi:PAS domain-containing protein
MPGFSGQEALDIARELVPDTPFIFVSGTIGEELAIDAMQRGAADYVLKDNLRRLQPAIERALRTARERARTPAHAARAARQRGALPRHRRDHRGLDLGARRRVPPRLQQRSVGQAARPHAARTDRQQILELMWRDRDARRGAAAADAGAPRLARWVLRWRHADGSVRLLESTAQPLLADDGSLLGYRGIDRDVTLRMQQASKIQQLARIQAVLSAHGNAVLRARDADALLR